MLFGPFPGPTPVPVLACGEQALSLSHYPLARGHVEHVGREDCLLVEVKNSPDDVSIPANPEGGWHGINSRRTRHSKDRDDFPPQFVTVSNIKDFAHNPGSGPLADGVSHDNERKKHDKRASAKTFRRK